MQNITVTYLEMSNRGAVRPKPSPDPRFWVREAAVKQWQFNRFLYDLVGSNWAWNDKRLWGPSQWQVYAEADNLRTFGAFYEGAVAGYYELKWDNAGGIELVIFGLAPKFIGRGLGAALLTSALEEAWRLDPFRVWLHTCSLDHPAALHNYQARGMKIYKVEQRQVG